MFHSRIRWGALLIVLSAALPMIGRAEDTSKDKKYEKVDRGPKTIEVSKYPQEMQDTYKNVFSKKCSKCHSLGRPINTDKTPEDWDKYVDKMMKKPNSNIDKKSAEKIKQFLIYDQKNRKDKK